MGKTSTDNRSLHVFGALSRGGAETWFLQALAHRGDNPWSADVCLLAGREGDCVRQARALGARVLHCPLRPAATFPARFLKLLREERYAAVHSHVLLSSGAIVALARLAATPLRVAHAHNASDGRAGTPRRRLYRAGMRRLIREHANLVLACSRQAARAFQVDGARILPYGIDLAPFAQPPGDGRARLGIPPGAPVLAAVGRLTPQKNYGFLLEAFEKALTLRPDLRLILAGEGELEADLRSIVAQREMTGRVHLLGLRDDVPALLAGLSDGFVMPSLHEGLPVALLEAQAAGLPCLVADTVSPEAAVLAGQVERLPLRGPWPQRLAALPSKRRLEPARASAAMRRAGFDAAQSWSRLTALYDSAIGPRRGARAA